MKIKQSYILIGLTTIILLAFAFVQYQNNNRKLDIQERQYQEQKAIKEKEESDERIRKKNLNSCIALADLLYWDYVKSNGTDLGNGEYRAFQYVWDNAQKRKDAKIEECKLLYNK